MVPDYVFWLISCNKPGATKLKPLTTKKTMQQKTKNTYNNFSIYTYKAKYLFMFL